MRDYANEGLSHDPIHGYITFTAGRSAGESTERDLIDHPWVQRLRQIHQLQTAWYVFPSGEHTRFQHVLGAMHLASRAAECLYDSLAQVCQDVPSRAYVESLLRVAALLHDVGHGPFGHFFDEHYLAQFHVTHEHVGAAIITQQLGDLIRGIRRNPSGHLAADEELDPRQVSYLICRPKGDEKPDAAPRWLNMLRSLFCGIYTVDNMDFVLRDAYMTGFNARAFDLDRLLHYSFFTDRGLTIHARGTPALARFVSVRAELFRSLYFHRTVRAIDLTLADLFAEGKEFIFHGNPIERLDEYRGFTEWSLLVDVARWQDQSDAKKRALGQRWQRLLAREIPWKLAAERTVFFAPNVSETASIFSRNDFFEAALRDKLHVSLWSTPLKVDLARHVHRPGTRGPAAGQNFLFEPAGGQIRPLADSELMRQIPASYRICRVYAETNQHDAEIADALDTLLRGEIEDSATNM